MQSFKTLIGHRDSVYDVAFSSDGSVIGSASRDGTIALWHTGEDTPEQTLTLGGFVTSVSFSSDNLLVAASNNEGRVNVWERATGTVLSRLEVSPADCIVFRPHGADLMIATRRGTIEQRHIETGQLVRELDANGDPVISLDFSNDGRTLAAATANGRLILYDGRSWAARGSCQPGGPRSHLYRCVVLPDRQTVAVSVEVQKSGPIGKTFDPNLYEVVIWNQSLEAKPDLSRSLVSHVGWIGGLAVTSSGQYLATGGFDEAVKLWDLPARQIVSESREHEGAIYGVDFSPDGSLLVSGSADGTLRLWRVADARPTIPATELPPLTAEWISERLSELARHGRSGVLVIAQDILDGLLALRSRALVERALSQFSPTTPGAYEVSTALMQIIEVRAEQARRWGSEQSARFYVSFERLINQILTGNITGTSEYKAGLDYIERFRHGDAHN